MNSLRNIISFPFVLFKILNSLKRQKQFIKVSVEKILKEHDTSNLSLSDISKIKIYYGNAVPAILGEGFCILRGKALTQKERYALTYLGSLTGLYDDFFDKLKTKENHILELTINPEKTNAENPHESLFIKFYCEALKFCSSKDILKEKFVQVYKAQIASKLQQDSTLSYNEIKDVTYFKGGISLIFYRSALENKTEKTEEELLYKLGSLMQLENDIFDIYKDNKDNISTLPTTTKSINNIRKIYTDLHQDVIQTLKVTKFNKKNKILFARYINLIICRGYVCLDCLESNEEQTNNFFSINEYTRKQLICDMEKPSNILKAFKYYSNSDISKLR